MIDISVTSIRMVRDRSVKYGGAKVTCADDVYRLFDGLLGDLDREAVWVLCRDVRGGITCISQVSVGTNGECIVSPAEVLKIALLSNAASFVLVHNHPSGDPSPSPEDIRITDRVGASAAIVGVHMNDHVIIGDGYFYSFSEEGEL